VKERLTGAIILVVLMVLLVPELLTGPIRSAPRATPAPPSADGAPLKSYTIHLADDPKPRGAVTDAPTQLAASPPAPQPVEATAPPTPPTPPTSPAAADRAATAPQDAHAAESSVGPAGNAPAVPAAASRAASGAGGWAVQLGSFANRANAVRLARQVKAQGFKTSVSQENSGRRLYRVRVGPAHDRAAASELASQLLAAGHRGAVVPK
jgi:DedD protein